MATGIQKKKNNRPVYSRIAGFYACDAQLKAIIEANV